MLRARLKPVKSLSTPKRHVAEACWQSLSLSSPAVVVLQIKGGCLLLQEKTKQVCANSSNQNLRAPLAPQVAGHPFTFSASVHFPHQPNLQTSKCITIYNPYQTSNNVPPMRSPFATEPQSNSSAPEPEPGPILSHLHPSYNKTQGIRLFCAVPSLRRSQGRTFTRTAKNGGGGGGADPAGRPPRIQGARCSWSLASPGRPVASRPRSKTSRETQTQKKSSEQLGRAWAGKDGVSALAANERARPGSANRKENAWLMKVGVPDLCECKENHRSGRGATTEKRNPTTRATQALARPYFRSWMLGKCS